MGKREAQKVISERLTLPSLPEVVLRLNALISDPKVGIQQIGDLVAQDAAITAKVLRISNSSYYGLKEPVLSAQQAAAVVGARSLRNIVMQASVFARYDHLAGLPDFDLDGIWRHAIFTGQIGQALAKEARKPLGLAVEEFYTPGLLHDIGKVVMLESLGTDYVKVFQSAKATHEPVHVIEAQILGYTHIEVGALVAAKWQLPDAVAKAIEFHHGPKYEIAANPAVAVVAIADQLAYRIDAGSLDGVVGRFAELADQVLGVDYAGFERVVEHARAMGGLIEI